MWCVLLIRKYDAFGSVCLSSAGNARESVEAGVVELLADVVRAHWDNSDVVRRQVNGIANLIKDGALTLAVAVAVTVAVAVAV